MRIGWYQSSYNMLCQEMHLLTGISLSRDASLDIFFCQEMHPLTLSRDASLDNLVKGGIHDELGGGLTVIE